ncbi:integrase SAM domain protein [Streptomyces sp. NPDC091377]|uniref:integrase SAM domain protein n=1 Tax=Streptomyces sp. NPDC091377 TaxID=3365995 RepID=UPI0038158EFD
MSRTNMTVAVRVEDDGWPLGDTVVLRSRRVRRTSAGTRMARFDDDVWPLTPAHPDAHAQSINLWWTTYPTTSANQFRTFVLAALDHPYPVAITGHKTIDRAGPGTVRLWFMRLRAFAVWLDHRGVERLSEADDQVLEDYLDHVRATSASPEVRRQLLGAVRALWAYAEFLPDVCRLSTNDPWKGIPVSQLAERPAPGRFNATPRIAESTMQPLLDWALRIVEDMGPDIRDAWRYFQALEAGVHPSQEPYRDLPPRERLQLFAQAAARSGVALPGNPKKQPGEISDSHLGLEPRRRTDHLGGQAKAVAARLGLPIADDCFIGTVTGLVNDVPWRDREITVAELPRLVRHAMAACFVVICYLTGTRPGEVLTLRRGCRDTDENSGELLIRGRPGKGSDRTPDTGADTEAAAKPSQPWVTVQPVHEAIALLESLHDADLLFPAELLTNNPRSVGFAQRSNQMNDGIESMVAWINDTFATPGEQPLIPPDPSKKLLGSRFRRTLAYFIVRRPRGLIAAALQYAHISTKVTLNYAGEGDTSWMEDLAVEKLEVVLEQIDDDCTLAEDGEHVSGPSAAEYRTRLGRVAKFSGRIVSSIRSVERLLHQADPDIHHGEGMTCVHRAETAECRMEKVTLGLPAGSGPDESFCRTSCLNLAYTDRDIMQLHRELADYEATASDALAPRPRRDRAAAQARAAQQVIDRHEATRPSGDVEAKVV